MKILFLGNNRVAWKVLERLKESDDEVVGLVLHPEMRRKYGNEIIAAANLHSDCIFDGSKLRETAILQSIKALGAEIGLSVFFGYILKPALLELFPQGCLNLHPALLPYNRGSYPNVWSIVDGTPAGATLHFIDTGVDTGDIVAQREITVEAVDTGGSLYEKLEIACIELFRNNWTAFKNGELKRLPQIPGAGTHYRINDVTLLDEIDLEREYKARDLINILRARSFPPYRGAYLRDGERKIYLELKLREEKDDE